MEEWGNGRANAYYEANMPSNVVRPKEGDSVRTIEKFIRDKYEHKKYIAKTIPDKISHVSQEAIEDSKRDVPLYRKEKKVNDQALPKINSETFAAFATTNTIAANVASGVQTKTAVVVPQPQPSLLDFMDDPVPVPSTTTTTNNNLNLNQAFSGSNDSSFFGNFQNFDNNNNASHTAPAVDQFQSFQPSNANFGFAQNVNNIYFLLL
jgi:hypothetical protein